MRTKVWKFLALLVAIVSFSSFAVLAADTVAYHTGTYTGPRMCQNEAYTLNYPTTRVYFNDDLTFSPSSVGKTKYVEFTFQGSRAMTFTAHGLLVSSMYVGTRDLTTGEIDQYQIYNYSSGASTKSGLVAGVKNSSNMFPYIDYFGIIAVRSDDITPPVIASHANVIAEATGSSGTAVTFTAPQVTDNVDSSFAATCTPASGSVFQYGTTAVTCTAQDKAGNPAIPKTFSVIIVDTTKPVLTVPANKTVEATAVNTPLAAVALGTATATDIFGTTVSSNAPATFPYGITTVTWTATDGHGLVSTATQTVTIVDTTKPVLTAPANKTVEATAVDTPAADVALGTATATDIFGAAVSNDAPAAFPYGATTVTWTATDGHGLVSTATQTITIADTTKPVLTAPANKTVEATAVDTPVADVVLGTATATDIFDAAVSNDAPATFPYGATIVTWTATDGHGLVSTATQTITIVDTTKPELTVPSDTIAEATAVDTPLTDVALGTGTATDIFGALVSNDAPATFPYGATTITWTATDGHGLISTATQIVTIVDTTAPVFTLVPADKTVEATAIETPVADINLGTATDIFGVSITNNAPGTFPLGPTTVIWTVTDGNGLQSTATQIITIVDTTNPVLSIPSDITIEATAIDTPLADVTLGTATASDIFGTSITNNAPAAFPLGPTTVIWTAADGNGLTTSANQIVTIVDTTKPVLSVPSDRTIEATAIKTPLAAAALGTATATDIFGTAITNNAPATFPLGATTVIWTATDGNGLQSTANQIITIVDTTRPVLSVPADKTVEATAVNTPLADVDLGAATTSDIFGAAVTNNAPATFPLGATTVIWTATDGNGLQSTANQIITVVDTTRPVLTVPFDRTVTAGLVIIFQPATATDIFGVSVTSNAPAAFPLGATTVIWTATDGNGLISSANQVITVVAATPTATPTPTPTQAADVLGANRATATPAATAAPTAVTSTGVLGAAKTGEAGYQNTIAAAIVLLAAFGVAGTVIVLRRRKQQD